LTVHAQSNNIFVLVDVSKSVTQTDMNNAKQALMEVLTGLQLSKAFIAQGNQRDLVNFKLTQGDKLAIVKFGSLQTTLAINPSPTIIQNTTADVNQAINSFSWTPTDNQTYITLAKAKIAEYTKNHGITKFKLYIISDNVQDDYGPNGKATYPDDYTRNLAESYNTTTNPVNEKASTKVKFSNTSSYSLTFIPEVDVSKYSLPGGVRPALVDTSSANAAITITSPLKAKKGKEHEMNSEAININWKCDNCPQGIKYMVTISQYESGTFREMKRDLVTNTANFKLPNGKFRVSVSAANYSNASSDTTYISVNTGSYGWIIFLLILVVAGAIGYYYWNKKRQEKIDIFTSNKSDDIYSKGSGGATAGNSSNSDYF
jgi:hypothetical protein